MVHINLFKGSPLLIFVSYLSMSLTEPQGRACYHAKICVHNAVEKCGIDSKGNLRRFFDSCDIKEYNCLKGTDFVKTPLEKCQSLPTLKDDNKKSEKAKYKPKIGAGGKSKVKEAEIKKTNLNKGKEEVKTNNRNEEDNINNDNDNVSNANDKRELNVILEEGEVSEDKVVPKRNVEMNVNSNTDTTHVIEVYDAPELKDYKEDSGHKSAIYTEMDETDRKINRHPTLNKYWCWRASTCKYSDGVICGMDIRHQTKDIFPGVCAMYTRNCHYNLDFTATNLSKCAT